MVQANKIAESSRNSSKPLGMKSEATPIRHFYDLLPITLARKPLSKHSQSMTTFNALDAMLIQSKVSDTLAVYVQTWTTVKLVNLKRIMNMLS